VIVGVCTLTVKSLVGLARSFAASSIEIFSRHRALGTVAVTLVALTAKCCRGDSSNLNPKSPVQIVPVTEMAAPTRAARRAEAVCWDSFVGCGVSCW